MSPDLKVLIQTPNSELYNGLANSVFLRTTSGGLEIFKGHAPLVGEIDFTSVKIRNDNKEEVFVLRNGTIFVHQDTGIKILAEYGEHKEQIDQHSAAEYLEIVLARLKNKESLNDLQILHLEEERGSLEKMLSVVEKQKVEKR